ncbi:hypothetical protein CIB84_015608 [Bambusicola thoracicus]|uniref:Ig-like domain-containing protein n=1 Tax=Bambusicola thoracicus TaxID=9083 RepID=A0A2P4S962_BAMTH|nr:hypothetical protein CIB84_015608 [Bambusicola thoracicus]
MEQRHFLTLLLLFFSAVAVSRAQLQQEPSAETSEGTGINITCSNPTIQTNYIHWYRQLPGRAPTFLVSAIKGSKKVPDSEGRLSVAADRRSSTLWISRPRLGDAAVYYCALDARDAKPGLRPGTNLIGRGGGAVPIGPAGNISALVVSANAVEIRAPRGDGDSITAEDAVNHSRAGGIHNGVLQVRAEAETKQDRYHEKGFNDDTMYLQLLAGLS